MLISRVFNYVREPIPRCTDSGPYFSGGNNLVNSKVNAGSDVKRELPMTVSRLSVVTAYVAFAFVGAIVLGVFG
jgi:hypothetical protein